MEHPYDEEVKRISVACIVMLASGQDGGSIEAWTVHSCTDAGSAMYATEDIISISIPMSITFNLQ